MKANIIGGKVVKVCADEVDVFCVVVEKDGKKYVIFPDEFGTLSIEKLETVKRLGLFSCLEEV